MGRKLIDAEILADYIAEHDMEFQYAIERQDREELESLIEKIPTDPCAECIEAGGCPIREDCPNEKSNKTVGKNQVYNKALDDLMQKIACDRTLLDGWQLRAIQRKVDQLKEVHHG